MSRRALRARGEVVGPVHVLGVSYGAATAIFAARDLGPQVGGVVAMESFDNAGAAIRAMVPHMLARAPERWSDYIALPFAQGRQAEHRRVEIRTGKLFDKIPKGLFR